MRVEDIAARPSTVGRSWCELGHVVVGGEDLRRDENEDWIRGEALKRPVFSFVGVTEFRISGSG